MYKSENLCYLQLKLRKNVIPPPLDQELALRYDNNRLTGVQLKKEGMLSHPVQKLVQHCIIKTGLAMPLSPKYEHAIKNN